MRTKPGSFGVRARLLTLLLPGIVCLLALDSWNDYEALRNQVQDAYDQAMLTSVNELRNSISPAQDGSLQLNAPVWVQSMSDAANPLRNRLHIGLKPHGSAFAQGRNLLGETDLPLPPEPLQRTTTLANSDPVTVWYDSHYRGHPVRLAALQGKVLDGQGQAFDFLIQVAEMTDARVQAQAETLKQEVIRDVRMVLVVILLVWLGVTWSLRPLERLRKSVIHSKNTELKPLDTAGVPHEVAPLVDAVNQHLVRYRDLLEQQSQFLADASHQLRTPLAIMLTQAGVALREENTEQLHKTLRAIVVQISRSRRLCEQLLSLAHASDNTVHVDPPEIVDLNTIARDVVLQYLSLAHEKNQDLGWVGAKSEQLVADLPDNSPVAPAPSAVPVFAREHELHEALSNLVHNAIAHTPRGGYITVMVSTCNGTARAEVRDNGPGIAAARRSAVFERFHSANPSEKSSHGAGLGLAIARAYARRNGGDIELADNVTDDANAGASRSGLRAILTLPQVSAQQL
jgi:two-component system sensor histidine kinase TctE